MTTQPLEHRRTVAVARPRVADATALRVLGSATLLVVGAVHLEQYIGVHFRVIPVIGPLFLLNFIGSVVVAVGLLLPLRRLHPLLALGGIGMSLTSIVFLLLSHTRPLFGFEDYGYRPAIVIALVAEGATALLLGAYLARRH